MPDWNLRQLIPHGRIVSGAGRLLLGMFLLTGCMAKKETPWVAPPRIVWSDITDESFAPRDSSYRILAPTPTRGFFPASLAVTRLAIRDEAPRSARRLHLVRDPRNEFLLWNATLDDQMAVSEVFPIAQRDLGGAMVEPEQINAAMRALHARIGLIYAVNQLTPHWSEMLGVLMDTSTAQPIATIYSQAKSILPPEPKDDIPPVLDWDHNSRTLVRRKFDRLVHACIRELILRDEPQRTEPPAGWIPVDPVLRVQWPPTAPPPHREPK